MKRHVLLFSALLLALAPSLIAGEGSGHKVALFTDEGKAMLAKKIAHIKNTPWDGLLVEGLFTGEEVRVTQVEANSPGEKAGVQVGDVLVAMNGDKMAGMSKETFYAAMENLSFGSEVTYKVKRAENLENVKVTMAQMPADMAAQAIGYTIMKYVEWSETESRELAANN